MNVILGVAMRKVLEPVHYTTDLQHAYFELPANSVSKPNAASINIDLAWFKTQYGSSINSCTKHLTSSYLQVNYIIIVAKTTIYTDS